jgi:hypothetical protein
LHALLALPVVPDGTVFPGTGRLRPCRSVLKVNAGCATHSLIAIDNSDVLAVFNEG